MLSLDKKISFFKTEITVLKYLTLREYSSVCRLGNFATVKLQFNVWSEQMHSSLIKQKAL